MPPAPIPSDEAARLAALAGSHVLDGSSHLRLDELVALAADLLDVPMAALSLIDADRQLLLSRFGLNMTETSRDVAFCSYTVLDRTSVLTVPDATLDARFVDNPLVTGEAHLRFYSGAPVLSREGQPIGALCVLDTKPRPRDIRAEKLLRWLADQVSSLIELQLQAREINAITTHDPVTGLASRQLFEERLMAAMDTALNGLPCGVIVLDLDHFRFFNDTQGTVAGNIALREVAQRLQLCIRSSDLLGRLGGDEFGVLVAGPVDQEAVTAIARRMEAALAEDLHALGQPVPLRGSIGLALAPAHGLDGPSVLRAAKQAVFAAKSAGRNTIRSPAGNLGGRTAPVTFDRTLRTDLEAAITAAGLDLHWQPIFRAADTRRVGYEALLRWNRPNDGPIPPSLFIPLAEENGLIGRLDAFVLERACKAATQWPEWLYVSVNMSAHWFGRHELVDMLRGVLTRTGLSPQRLVVELTERTLVQHTDLALRVVEEMRAMGVRLALDDFGVGYSSFGYLRRFAFDILKLDRDFVRPLGQERVAAPIAKAIIELGHSMDMSVCAEGVETEAQLAALQAMGCDTVQGYLLGRPDAAIALLPDQDLLRPVA